MASRPPAWRTRVPGRRAGPGRAPRDGASGRPPADRRAPPGRAGAGRSREWQARVHERSATALAKAGILWVDVRHAGRRGRPGGRRLGAGRSSTRSARTSNPGTLVLVSSQVPGRVHVRAGAGVAPADPSLQFACSPENLGSAGRSRCSWPGAGGRRDWRGDRSGAARRAVRAVLGQIEWMSLESAEMTKHALNGSWRSRSPTPTSWPRICERVGADASEVERGLRRAPDRPAGLRLAGAAAGRRDAAQGRRVPGPARRRAGPLQPGRRRRPDQQSAPPGLVVHPGPGAAGRRRAPRAAILGLTYKPGTDTLRRSAAVDLARALLDRGVEISAYGRPSASCRRASARSARQGRRRRAGRRGRGDPGDALASLPRAYGRPARAHDGAASADRPERRLAAPGRRSTARLRAGGPATR